jgi:hypothetical protein
MFRRVRGNGERPLPFIFYDSIEFVHEHFHYDYLTIQQVIQPPIEPGIARPDVDDVRMGSDRPGHHEGDTRCM